ncbi:MAG: DnaA/Hda family protein, partial [Candidatus Hydrogenedentota bacterium]
MQLTVRRQHSRILKGAVFQVCGDFVVHGRDPVRGASAQQRARVVCDPSDAMGMSRYTFDKFRSSARSAEALEVCRALAGGSYSGPRVVTFLGDTGSGKTHLLYAIVNEVRARSASIGIAYITAKDFPKEVLALIRDPRPLQRAKKAILLIDHLDQFTERLEELDAVAGLFLDNGHTVAVATRVHPGRVRGMPRALSNHLRSGRLIRLDGAPAKQDEPFSDVVQHGSRRPAQVHEAPERNVVDSLKSEVARLMKENEDLRGLRREYERLEGQLGELREGYEEALDELRRQENTEAELESLRRQLESARHEGAEARQEADTMLLRAEELLEHVQENRRTFEAVQREQTDRLRELDQIEAALSGPRQFTGDDVDSAVAEGQFEWDQGRKPLIEEIQLLRESVAAERERRIAAESRVKKFEAASALAAPGPDAAVSIELDSRRKADHVAMIELEALQNRLIDATEQIHRLAEGMKSIEIAPERAEEPARVAPANVASFPA